MPAWDDYKATAKSRGALAFELFMVHSTPAGSPDQVKENLGAHLAYQAELEARGALFLAGPVSDETGALMEGMGLIIYRAASLEDARALADGDPMHQNGARRYVLRRWLINEGSLSLSIGLSAQSIVLD
ncbi:MAG: YciI family protein [Pseudomonadota bacterium]